jgi:hypothetical protein
MLILLLSLLASASFAATEAPLLKLRPIPFSDVKVADAFWAPRQETNRLASIPANLENLEKAGNIRNFELAAAGKHAGYSGPVFMDSDLYKGLEAAAYSLATHPDPALARKLDEIIAKIAAAQQPNGYLNTHFQVVAPDRKWTNLRDWHELYCAGHMFEGAVAHCQATGKRNFLNVAIKYADHIDATFGPGKRLGYPGHPEIELALIKLWRVTGERRYFELARFFIESRGRKFFAEEHKTPLDKYDGSYWQDDVPICDHRNIKGHAVRACYLLAGATDVVAETQDPALLKMLNRVWRNTTQRNMYLTGGIGPSAHNEGFTSDYDLPNLTAYQETCASVALALWNHRLALLYGDARFADVFERSLYNGVLAGVSWDGTRFFYVNPLESRGTHHRSPWFGCACCPPNVARTVAAIGGYAYALSEKALWVNLYIQGSVATTLDGNKLALKVTTDYPWDGKVTLEPRPEKPARFDLRLRVPGWCQGATVSVNHQPVARPTPERGYLVLSREWQSGDAVDLTLPMPVERLAASPNVKADQGALAIQRGPLVYCLEQVDQPEPIPSFYLPANAALNAEKDAQLFGGIVVIKGLAVIAPEQDWSGKLYQSAATARQVPVTAIPYYAWDNRQPGPMKVWLPVAPQTPVVGGLETRAKVTVSFANNNSQPAGINDGVEPKNSGEQPASLCHWWPHKDRTEWAQYTWKTPATVNGAKVYWFDDTGRGNCRLPASWRLEYLDGPDWRPVKANSDYPIAKDKWCEVKFAPVTTPALRLAVKLQPDWAAGVHEWKVAEVEED